MGVEIVECIKKGNGVLILVCVEVSVGELDELDDIIPDM